ATTSAQTGASSGQLLELARDEDVQAELGLTDEQIQQIEQAATESRDRSGLSDLYRRSREAKTDEERAAIREEMQQSLQRRQQQLDERLKSGLSSQQLTRLQQLAAEDGAD